jgi:hypothetical protein
MYQEHRTSHGHIHALISLLYYTTHHSCTLLDTSYTHSTLLSWPSPLEPRVSPKYRPLKFPSGRSRETHETQPFQFLTTLSLQPSSVVTLVLSPTYSALYGTSFFPTPTRVSSARGTYLAPVSSASGIHAESLSHVRRKPRHVPIPPFIPSGETPSRRGLFHTNTPPRWEWPRFHPHDHLRRNPITRPKLFRLTNAPPRQASVISLERESSYPPSFLTSACLHVLIARVSLP